MLFFGGWGETGEQKQIISSHGPQKALKSPSTQDGLYSGRAVSPLNSRMATIVAANSVSKFGGILFTRIRIFAVVCYAAGPLKVRRSYRRQIVPPPPPTPLHIHRYICLRLVQYSIIQYSIVQYLIAFHRSYKDVELVIYNYMLNE